MSVLISTRTQTQTHALVAMLSRGDPSRPKAEQEFKVMTPPKSFVVQTASAAEANSWLEDIQAAARYCSVYSGLNGPLFFNLCLLHAVLLTGELVRSRILLPWLHCGRLMQPLTAVPYVTICLLCSIDDITAGTGQYLRECAVLLCNVVTIFFWQRCTCV